MKKILISVMLIAVLAMVVAPFVNATTSNTLSDDLYAKLSAYGMTTSHKVRVERYLEENTVTDEQAQALMAKADEAVAVMDAEGTKNYSELSAEAKSKLKTIAQEAASTIGLTLVFKSGEVEIYKDGKLIEVVTLSSSGTKLAYTGNTVNMVLVVVPVVAIALTIALVVRKRKTTVGA